MNTGARGILLASATLAVVLSVPGCRKDNYDRLSKADQEAFDGMKAAYSGAVVYDDYLAQCQNPGDTCTPQYLGYCDSLYHHYEYLWEHHHDRYGHDNAHDDHYHDRNGAMHHHRKRKHHDTSKGHHEFHHEQMEQLRTRHQAHHPE